MRAASCLPQSISQGRDVGVSELDDAMFIHRCLTVLMSLLGVFERFPGMFVSGQMLAPSLLLPRTVGVRCGVVQFRGSLVILVM